MHIKASIVAYAFSVQCFENATIVACAGLRVNGHLNHKYKFTKVIRNTLCVHFDRTY